MKILITGNMGYIGPVLTKYLRSIYDNIEIYGLDTGYFGNIVTNPYHIPEILLDQQYYYDIRTFPVEILNGIDAVVHLAAISNDPIGNRYEAVTYQINYEASIRLAKAAKAARVRKFVFASSCSMYGAAKEESKKETDTLNPLTAYAKSKVLTERDLEELASEDFTITCLRFATACGMSERLRLDLVLNDFVANAIASGNILILSDGTPWRPLINVRDMARAIDWALHRNPSQAGKSLAVNVGSSEWNYQVKELANAVKNMMPNTLVEINKDAQPDKRSYHVNFNLFKELAPNHQPVQNLGNTIEELKNGLEAIDFRDAQFHDSTMIRLNAIERLKKKGLLNENLDWRLSESRRQH